MSLTQQWPAVMIQCGLRSVPPQPGIFTIHGQAAGIEFWPPTIRCWILGGLEHRTLSGISGSKIFE